jgi:hypothetical protein
LQTLVKSGTTTTAEFAKYREPNSHEEKWI